MQVGGGYSGIGRGSVGREVSVGKGEGIPSKYLMYMYENAIMKLELVKRLLALLSIYNC
jgi:hypothetical protein